MTMFVDERTHERAMTRHGVHHRTVRSLEPDVVLEEVHMAIDMRHDQLLLHFAVATHEISPCGIVVDYELIDLGKPPRTAFLQALPLHAKAP